jgi:hypothetical protein
MTNKAPVCLDTENVNPRQPKWSTRPLTTPEATAEMDTWIERFQPALQLALDEFLANAKWPERERRG